MKVVVQRVSKASVSVHGDVVSSIQKGFLLLVGFTHNDQETTAGAMAKKIAKLRVFSDEEGKMNRSITDVSGEILSISQFTVYADTSGGNRPSFTQAMDYRDADRLYRYFNQTLRDVHHLTVFEGVFGEHMDVALTNDGPVTVILEK